MPCTRHANAHHARLRILAILLLAGGGLSVGNAGNARHADSPAPASGVVAQASA